MTVTCESVDAPPRAELCGTLARTALWLAGALTTALVLTGMVAIAAPAAADRDTGHPNMSLVNVAEIGGGWSGIDVIFAGDVNGDHLEDILAITPSGALMLYPGRGTTTYRPPVQVGNGWRASFTWVGAVDFTGDGLVDLLARTAAGDLLLYANRGGTGFRASVKIGQGWATLRELTVVPRGPSMKPALFAIRSDGALWRYDGNGAGRFVGSTRVGPGWSGVTIHAGGDMDRSGVSDLLVVDSAGVLRSYLGRTGNNGLDVWRLGHGFGGYTLGIVTAHDGSIHLRGVRSTGALRDWTVRWSPAGQPEATAVFVYGTLLTGQPNHARLVGRYSAMQRTSIGRHALYRVDGRNWPYAVPQSGYTTYGEVYWLTPGQAQATIADLDRLERYDPSQPPTNQTYVRVRLTTNNGSTAWAYVTGPRTAAWLKSSGTVMPSGDWLRR